MRNYIRLQRMGSVLGTDVRNYPKRALSRTLGVGVSVVSFASERECSKGGCAGCLSKNNARRRVDSRSRQQLSSPIVTAPSFFELKALTPIAALIRSTVWLPTTTFWCPSFADPPTGRDGSACKGVHPCSPCPSDSTCKLGRRMSDDPWSPRRASKTQDYLWTQLRAATQH